MYLYLFSLNQKSATEKDTMAKMQPENPQAHPNSVDCHKEANSAMSSFSLWLDVEGPIGFVDILTLPFLELCK